MVYVALQVLLCPGLFQDNWIEAQLSHIDKNRTRASYNHADYLAQRTEMMQWWGDYLVVFQKVC